MCVITMCLMLAALGGPPSGDEDWLKEKEGYRSFADYQAVKDVAEFDLGSISDKDAANWAVLRIVASDISGSPLISGSGKTLKSAGIASLGGWERIGTLRPLPNVKPKGVYDCTDPATAGEPYIVTLGSTYHPLYYGGVVLAQHYPEKAGKGQFGTIVMLSEDTAKWVPAAYEFRRKNADLFGKQFKEHRLVQLLGDENPMIAVMAAQRLAGANLLTGKALGAALDGPADFRRAVAIYLAFASRNPESDESYYDKHSDDRPPPEIESAIRKADVKMLRLYAMALAEVSDEGFTTEERAAALKLCRERAKALHLDKKLQEELNNIFEQFDMPKLDSK